MLEIKDIRFGYGKDRAPVLCGMDMSLDAGEVGILLGRNGVGKSTLFKIITGYEKASSGSVMLDSEDLLKMSFRERARRIAYVPQDPQFGSLCVFDSVLAGRVAYFGFKAGKKDIEITKKTLEETGLSPLAERRADTLSGGERQKVAIARALCGEPKLVIFDEPTGNLDIAGERMLIKEIKKLSDEKNLAVLCSLHGLQEAYCSGDKFFFMKDGRIFRSGGKEIFTSDTVNTVFGTDVRLVGFGDGIVVTENA